MSIVVLLQVTSAEFYQMYNVNQPRINPPPFNSDETADNSTMLLATDALECSICQKRFAGRNKRQNLKHHLMTHTGERNYLCPYCAHRTTHKWHLKTHVQRRHPENLTDVAVSWLGFKNSSNDTHLKNESNLCNYNSTS